MGNKQTTEESGKGEDPVRMRVLDIAPDRARRREFAKRIADDGHDVVTVPGRREALKMLKGRDGPFDLAVLDASSDLYDTKELVAELCKGASNEPIIAVVVEPRNRPPRHRVAGRAPNVVFLQDGSVEHMTRIVRMALSIRDGGVDQDFVEELLPEEGFATTSQSGRYPAISTISGRLPRPTA
jgi:CheY-like chemotaxis protein